MPEEDNPFMVKPKKAEEPKQKEEPFGSEEMVSFMVTPGEEKKTEEQKLFTEAEKPHWESSGTPIWDRKTKNVDEEDYEVVDHN